MKKILLCTGMLFSLLYAQVPDTTASIRMQIWAELDAYPALANAFEKNERERKADETNAGEQNVNVKKTDANLREQKANKKKANVENENINEKNARQQNASEKNSANENADNDFANGKIFDYAKERMKTLGSFLVGGMLYGWNFTYTPSDKLRGVPEFMEFSDVQSKESFAGDIHYKGLLVREGKVYSWLEFKKTETMIQNYFLWSSIVNEKIHGLGYGKIEDGFQGIEDAVRDAIKNAVRAHFRTKIKNKPKEITGRVLLLAEPLIGISSGRYKVQLDFFLETDRITPYTQF